MLKTASNYANGPPRFSILVVTYNNGNLLPRALDSILTQDGDDFEVLVVDDGSTDHTSEVAGRYGSRIRYLHQAHAGNGQGCRLGYRASSGQYLIFVDADDRLRQGALAALRTAADGHPQARLILSRTCSVSADQRINTQSPPSPLHPDPRVNFARFARGRWRASIAGSLIHRALLAPFDREGSIYPHGLDKALLGFALLHGCVQIDTVTLYTVHHPGRLRDDLGSIERSGLALADLLFDPALLPADELRHRSAFVATLHRTRCGAYHRAGRHPEAWREYRRAVASDPRSLLDLRVLRRAMLSFACTPFARRQKCVVNSPPSRWLSGHHRDFWRDPVAFLEGCARQFGPVVRLRLHRPYYLLCEPADARHVLLAGASAFEKTGILRRYNPLTSGLVGMERDQHRNWRRCMQGQFTKQAVQSFAPVIVDMLRRHVAAWQPKDNVNVFVALQKACVEMSARITFGPEIAPVLPRLLHLVQRTHHFAARDLRAWPAWPAWVPLHRRRRLAALDHELALLLAPFVAARRAQPMGDDLLSALVRAAPDGPDAGSDHMLRNQALMLFIAGFEPVSGTLAWALRLLAEHPHVQDQVAAEAFAECGEEGPTAADVPRLGFTTQVVDEVLRLYPNEWMLTRLAIADDRLPCGLKVRRGEEVLISPYLLQRDPRFFPNPDHFDPSRFAPGNAVPRDAYMPFGMGTRICLGASLAVLEITLALALILRRWRFAPATLERPRLESVNLFSSQPRDGEVWLRLEPRLARLAAG